MPTRMQKCTFPFPAEGNRVISSKILIPAGSRVTKMFSAVQKDVWRREKERCIFSFPTSFRLHVLQSDMARMKADACRQMYEDVLQKLQNVRLTGICHRCSYIDVVFRFSTISSVHHSSPFIRSHHSRFPFVDRQAGIAGSPSQDKARRGAHIHAHFHFRHRPRVCLTTRSASFIRKDIYKHSSHESDIAARVRRAASPCLLLFFLLQAFYFSYQPQNRPSTIGLIHLPSSIFACTDRR